MQDQICIRSHRPVNITFGYIRHKLDEVHLKCNPIKIMKYVRREVVRLYCLALILVIEARYTTAFEVNTANLIEIRLGPGNDGIILRTGHECKL